LSGCDVLESLDIWCNFENWKILWDLVLLLPGIQEMVAILEFEDFKEFQEVSAIDACLRLEGTREVLRKVGILEILAVVEI
ncbi:unnamed protein product, partial [Adineta steineri]